MIVALNAAVSAAKLICGLTYDLAAMTADGIHSMTDGLNNVVGMIGIYFAYQPKDKKHPYGHRKFETMTTLIISALLITTALNLLKSAYDRVINPVTPTVEKISFYVMIFTIVINVIVYLYEKSKSKELHSDFLISDAAHTLSDVFVSFSVIGTLVVVRLGFNWIDIVVSVIITVLILKAAVKILKEGSDVLCDAAVFDPANIAELVCRFDEVKSCHAVRSHGRTDDAHIDMHIMMVCDAMSLDDIHSLVHKIEENIKMVYPGVADVSIHVDPPDNEC
jgi:cation diffusion facilitator family transporter